MHTPPTLHLLGLPTVPPPLRVRRPYTPRLRLAWKGSPSVLRLCRWLAAPNKPGCPALVRAGRRMEDGAGSPATQVWTRSVHKAGGGAGPEKVPGARHVASPSTLLRAGQGRWAAWTRPHLGLLRSPLKTHFYRKCGHGGARRCARRGPQTQNPTSSVSLCPLCPRG